ncbi:hypothetical protein BMF94_2355 [Rhodotorula taiwanensis]|uniref:J domain-containing protein n=1 Tax=Rhodotorula taiwanensis TaxID=741276 RepID=A0A2S5BCU6_9BASI|nr:hypothetical protein BMF94_2355 [Rhodotorula taiwanensis]
MLGLQQLWPRAARNTYRAACGTCPPPPRPAHDSRPFSSSRPSNAAPALSSDVDHYKVLELPKEATRKQIKERFYDLSRKYHPDAPSTSSDSPEQRTARFQQLSQSYSVLSDPDQRRSYDLSRTGSTVPPHRRRPHHPGYTSATPGMGYDRGGRDDGAWTDNDERRTRANYAWQHPGRGKSAGDQAAGTAQARTDPFANRRSRAQPSTTDHFTMYADRAKVRSSQARANMGTNAQTGYAGPHTGSHYQAGTSVFGAAKAAEESRLINDSSTIRSGQVAFVFLSVFFIAYSLRHDDQDKKNSRAKR